MKLSSIFWNLTPKPSSEVQYTADRDDIIYKLGGLWCCCQTRANVNNIIVFSNSYDIGNIQNIMKFLVILHEQYNIDYIRVESIKNKYILFKRLFGMNMLLQPTINGRDVYWCHITDDTIKKINNVFFSERTTK